MLERPCALEAPSASSLRTHPRRLIVSRVVSARSSQRSFGPEDPHERLIACTRISEGDKRRRQSDGDNATEDGVSISVTSSKVFRCFEGRRNHGLGLKREAWSGCLR
jgi:hypothetical protein